jgi:hypothetical protein
VKQWFDAAVVQSDLNGPALVAALILALGVAMFFQEGR